MFKFYSILHTNYKDKIFVCQVAYVIHIYFSNSIFLTHIRAYICIDTLLLRHPPPPQKKNYHHHVGKCVSFQSEYRVILIITAQVRMYLCMYVCMCVCVYIYTHTHTHIYVCMYVRIYVCMYIFKESTWLKYTVMYKHKNIFH